MRGRSLLAASVTSSVIALVSMRANAQILTDEPLPSPARPPPAAPAAPPSSGAQAAPAPSAQPSIPPPTVAPAPTPAVSPPAAAPATTAPPAAAPAASQPSAPAAVADDGVLDHDRFVGHFAVGYLGIAQLPIGSANGTATINAPVIGGRYWVKRELGIDAGVGFALASGSTESGGTSADKPSQLGIAFHGGLPINFAYGKHYVFQLVPETTVGFTSATIKGNPDVSLSGFRLDIGARAGAEIHFGFIGVPELALQASIGLFLHRESRSATPSGGSGSGESTTTFATSVQGDPWALFANNISALYYF